MVWIHESLEKGGQSQHILTAALSRTGRVAGPWLGSTPQVEVHMLLRAEATGSSLQNKSNSSMSQLPGQKAHQVVSLSRLPSTARRAHAPTSSPNTRSVKKSCILSRERNTTLRNINTMPPQPWGPSAIMNTLLLQEVRIPVRLPRPRISIIFFQWPQGTPQGT